MHNIVVEIDMLPFSLQNCRLSKRATIQFLQSSFDLTSRRSTCKSQVKSNKFISDTTTTATN